MSIIRIHTARAGVRNVMLVAVAATAAAVAGLAGPAHASVQAKSAVTDAVQITVDADGVHGPGLLSPGVTHFHTSSSLPGTDSIAVVRLNDGVSYDEIFGYLSVGDLGSVFQHVTGKSGLAHAGVHNGGEWTSILTAGNYLYVDDEHGLVAPFQVAGARTKTPRPADRGAVEFINGTFRIPSTFGDGTWRFHNGDTMQHGLGFVYVEPGHSDSEIFAAVANGDHPSWMRADGTLNILGPGETAWLSLHDMHGTYVALDYLPMIQGATDQPVAQIIHVA